MLGLPRQAIRNNFIYTKTQWASGTSFIGIHSFTRFSSSNIPESQIRLTTKAETHSIEADINSSITSNKETEPEVSIKTNKAETHKLLASMDLNQVSLISESASVNHEGNVQEAISNTEAQQFKLDSLQELTSLSDSTIGERETKPHSQSYQSEKDVLALNPLYYTIQIASTESESEATEIIELLQENGFNQPLFYYHSPRQDETWYPVLSGYYKTKTEAQTSQLKLPGWIKQKKPFIRQLANVQDKNKTV